MPNGRNVMSFADKLETYCISSNNSRGRLFLFSHKKEVMFISNITHWKSNKLNMGFRAWIVAYLFCWISLHFNLTGGIKGEKIARGAGGGAIIWRRRLIEERLLFEEIRYSVTVFHLRMSQFLDNRRQGSSFPCALIELVWNILSSFLINIRQSKIVEHHSRAMIVVFSPHRRVKSKHVTTIICHLLVKRKIITRPFRDKNR